MTKCPIVFGMGVG